jgi:hypothetical protein
MIYCRRRQWLAVGDILFVFMQTGPLPSFPPVCSPSLAVVEMPKGAEDEGGVRPRPNVRGERPRFRDGIANASPPNSASPSTLDAAPRAPEPSVLQYELVTTSPPIDGPVGMRLPSRNHTKRRHKAWQSPSTAAAAGPIIAFLDFCGSSPSMAISTSSTHPRVWAPVTAIWACPGTEPHGTNTGRHATRRGWRHRRVGAAAPGMCSWSRHHSSGIGLEIICPVHQLTNPLPMFASTHSRAMASKGMRAHLFALPSSPCNLAGWPVVFLWCLKRQLTHFPRHPPRRFDLLRVVAAQLGMLRLP